jgi:glycosyltransferase involved in cell wall biosynthesis
VFGVSFLLNPYGDHVKLSDMTSRPPEFFVFVEPDAHLIRGHAGDQLIALAGAARALGHRCLIIGSNGVEPELRRQLELIGVEVKGLPRQLSSRHGCLALVAGGLFMLAELVEFASSERSWWRGLQDASRSVREAAALTFGASSGGSSFVVLSANERLVATSAFLAGGIPHLRVVHDVTHGSSGPISWLDRLTRSARRCCLTLCTSEGAAVAIQSSQPGLRAVVESFGTVEVSLPPTGQQRAEARSRLDLDDIPYGCMVGGWWPPKDIETVVRALQVMTTPIGIVVGGAPLDERLLGQLDAVLGDRLVVIPDQLDPQQKAAIYHAVDFSLVSREPGAAKESGLIADALRFRVPLVVSDHDKRLAAKIVFEPWAAVFQAGASPSLALALARASEGLAIPPADAQEGLGFRNAVDQLRCYLLWDRVLKERVTASRPRP